MIGIEPAGVAREEFRDRTGIDPWAGVPDLNLEFALPNLELNADGR